MHHRQLVVRLAALASALLALESAANASCDDCTREAQKMRDGAAQARAAVSQLRSSAPTFGGTGGAGQPSMSSQYAQMAAAYDEAARKYDAAYNACTAGQPSECGGAGGGAGGAGGASGPGGAGGGGASSRKMTPAQATRQLAEKLAAQLQKQTDALKAANAALAASKYNGASSETARDTARAVGNVDLDEAGALDAPPGNYVQQPPRPGATANGTNGTNDANDAAPGGVGRVPASPASPPGAPGTPGAAPTDVLGTLVPLAAAPPAATEQEMMNGMVQSAASPTPAPPSAVLGLGVDSESQAGPGKGTFNLSPDTIENMAKKGIEYSAPKVAPDFVGAAEETKRALTPLEDVYHATRDSSGESMEAGARLIARGASSEVEKKNIENSGKFPGGAQDMMVREWDGRPESEATEREKFVSRIGNGDMRALSYLTPKPFQKAVEVLDSAEQKLTSAKATADRMYTVGGAAFKVARSYGGAARDRVYGQVRELFGYPPPAEGP